METDVKTNPRAWSIFSLVPDDKLAKIKIACVFGNLGNEVIFITDNDEAYGFGSNSSGCLGFGDIVSTLQPRLIPQLCLKSIVGFAYGSGPHVLAYSQSGDIYAWGHNGYCQLGNGTTNQCIAPTLIQGTLQGKVVIDAACGSHHSLVLTNDGEIFSWGQNNCGQIGTGTTTNQPTPRKISTSFGCKKVIAISCGQTSSMAVLESGEVYGWGYNGNGQLGLGNNINQLNPCKVTALQSVVITKIVCGYAHTMALSDEGHLYTWGANSYGQLGTGNKSNCCTPGRVAEDIGRVVEIAATHYNHISVAKAQKSNKVYMWGQCFGQSVVLPNETPFGTMHEIFAYFATPIVTFKPMATGIRSGPTVLDSLRLAFNDQETSDIKFVSEERVVYVHKSILKIRSEYFRAMFQDHWEESRRDELGIPSQFSFEVFRAFLKYLYTGEVDLQPEDAVGLLDLANSYCEHQLKSRCENLIRQGITIDNVAMLYATAIKFQAKDLEDFCFQFMLNHMTAVTQTKAFSDLDEISLLKEFIQKAAHHNAFRS